MGFTLMKKNILILSYSDSRGDGIATYNFAKLLIQQGYEVRLMVLNKSRSDSFIIQPVLDQVINRNVIYRVIKKVVEKISTRLKKQVKVPTNKKYDFFV